MTTGPSAQALARVRGLLRRHPLVDGHNDLPWALRQGAAYDLDAVSLEEGTAGTLVETHTDWPRAEQGGLGGQFWSVFVPGHLADEQAVIATLEQIDCVHRLVRRYPDRLGLALTAEDVTRVHASGRIASLLGAEGGHSIGCSLPALRMLYALGVRYMTLTHNENIAWADSATDLPRIGGLSRFGVEVVREMNRLGMLVDLSHVSPGTMSDALDASEAPVIFSHSSARAVCDSPRNVPDDVLGRLPANGGVCMVTFVPPFVSQAAADWRAERREAALAAGIDPRDHVAFTEFTQRFAGDSPVPQATLADVVAHCEHVREVAGIEHIGLGGDYDGVDQVPVGLEDVSGYPRLLGALAERGWSEDDLARLAGGNVLRALRGAEDVARELSQQRGPSLATIALDGPDAAEV